MVAQAAQGIPFGRTGLPDEGRILYTVRIDAVGHHSYRNAVNVDGGQIVRLVAGFVAHLDKQLYARQFSEQDGHKAVRQLCVNGQAVCGEGFQARSKVLADAAHEEQDECVAITAAQFVADALEGVGMQALIGVAQLCAEQTDAPRNLHPQHEEGDGCERTVDGVVGTQLNLVVDIQPFHSHEDKSGQDARPDCVAPLDPRIGHKREEQHKSHYGKDKGRDMQEERHRLAEQLCVGQQGAERLHEDAHTAADDHHEGEQQEDADIVYNLAIDGARAFHEPDGVEGLLDVRGQREQRVEQENQADADEDAALGVLQVGIHEVENRVGNVGIALERALQLGFNDGVEAEAPGDGEDDGQHGNGGQHAAVREGGGIVHDVVLGDALPSNHEPLQQSQSQPLPKAELLLVHAPYMFQTNHTLSFPSLPVGEYLLASDFCYALTSFPHEGGLESSPGGEEEASVNL